MTDNDTELLTVQHNGKTYVTVNPRIENMIDPENVWIKLGPFLIFELREVKRKDEYQ